MRTIFHKLTKSENVVHGDRKHGACGQDAVPCGKSTKSVVAIKFRHS